MSDRIDKIKAHLREHKVVYLASGASFIVGGLTVWAISQKVEINISQKAFLNWKSKITQEQNISINMPARGHRGNMVFCNETKKFFSSQGEAAREMGLNPGTLSSHLTGKYPDAGGYTFKNLGENLSEEVKLSV